MTHHYLPLGYVLRHPLHITVDLLSLGAIVGSVVQIIPVMAAFPAAVWYSILIWESETVRKITGRLEAPPPPEPIDEVKDENET
jgi:hypothetical protein